MRRKIDASANVFLYDFNVSNNEGVHLNIWLSGVNTELSNISYGYGFIGDEKKILIFMNCVQMRQNQ